MLCRDCSRHAAGIYAVRVVDAGAEEYGAVRAIERRGLAVVREAEERHRRHSGAPQEQCGALKALAPIKIEKGV